MNGQTLYSIDEVVLIPKGLSNVNSRSTCVPYDWRGNLPIWIAAMSCLVNEKNYLAFEKKGFNTILPRTVSWETRLEMMRAGQWIAVGLDEARKILDLDLSSEGTYKISIDIANGHQMRALEMCTALRDKFKNAEIMVGNIANPDTYIRYAYAGANYVRVGIGSGQVCTTSVQTGIHYPMASLISKCRELKEFFNLDACIVADGGFGYIDQIVKALALGADYVMIGKIAASFPEACGETALVELKGHTVQRCREYYGMSTEKAQRLMHPEPDYVPKHTEGTVRWIPIIEDSQKWVDDFTHALRSSMSYQDATTLADFIGKVEWGIQNPTTFNAYIKS